MSVTFELGADRSGPRIDSAPRSAEPRSSRLKRGLRRATHTVLAVSLLVGGLLASPPEPAQALARGEQMSFPYVGTISNFILPDGSGRRAYCVEVQMGEPNGSHSYAGRLNFLPGMAGQFSSYDSPEGMRQMNYIITNFGQSGNAYRSAAAQIAVWAIRGDTAYFGDKLPKLLKSAQGQAVVNDAQAMINEARALAKPPAAPKAITGKLAITDDPGGKVGRYRVAYPKGVVKLSATNGKWVRNGAATLPVDGGKADARYIDVTKTGTPLNVSASWEVTGAAGYEAQLFVWNTSTSSGQTGQRVAVATGQSTKAALKGTLNETVNTRPKDAFPNAYSQAHPSAEVGSTMKDLLIVSAVPNTSPVIWPNAVAEFTAYLAPEAGKIKYDNAWNPKLGDPYDAQAENPDTGELLWKTWWTQADGTPVLDDAGTPIAVAGPDGTPTSGTAPDGTVYPVQKLDNNGEPIIDGSGLPVYYTDRAPVMEQRQDPVKWTQAEIDGMSAADLCTAQPVYREGGIAVTALGTYTSKEVPVKSAGTVHWVDRVTSNGSVVHESKCGIANERTKIGQPGVVTSAVPKATIGDELYDTLHFTGTLVPGVAYEARVDAYQSPPVDPANPQPVVPMCAAENRIFRSEKVPVTSTADLRMPGFIAEWQHSDTIWWTHSFYADGQLIDQGECGLPDETTTLTRPTFRTQAVESAVAGDLIKDTIIAEGEFTANPNAEYSVTFAEYKETYKETNSKSANPAPGDEKVFVPVCEPANLAFSLNTPVTITGPGSYESPPVVALPEYEGKSWWVETVTLKQGGKSEVIHVGECGLPNETTTVTAPDVVTKATGFAVTGDVMTDTATITGKLTEREGVTHDVVFEGYVGDPASTGTDQATCDASNLAFTTDAVAVPAESTLVNDVETREVTSPEVTALPTHGMTVWWVETLRQKEGEKITELNKGKCGLPNETTTITKPTVKTKSAGKIMVGDEMFDTAIVEGKFPKNPEAAFTVTFKAYEYDANGQLTCSPETELKAFEDTTGVMVDKAGEYRSKRVTTTRAHAQIGGYVETLTMTVDKKSYNIHVGKCGEVSEKFEVADPKAPLTETGTANMLWFLGLSGGLLLLGGGAVVLVAVRRFGARV